MSQTCSFGHIRTELTTTSQTESTSNKNHNFEDQAIMTDESAEPKGVPNVVTPSSNHFGIDERYCVVKFLGEGGFGSVFLVYDNQDYVYRALKMAKDTDSEPTLNNEILIMRNMFANGQLDNEPVSHLLDWKIGTGEILSEENEVISSGLSYFVTEYCENGDLGTLILENPELSKRYFPKIFKQLVGGIEGLHKKGFVHLDLKPDNILLDNQLNIRIADFALTRPIQGEDNNGFFYKYRAGSKRYWAPEMFLPNGYSGIQADIYALGITLFVMVFGSMPFQYANVQDIGFQLLASNPIEFWKGHPEASKKIQEKLVCPDLVKLLNSMLCPIPKFRLDINGIRSSRWYSNMEASEIVHIKDRIGLSEERENILTESDDDDGCLLDDY